MDSFDSLLRIDVSELDENKSDTYHTALMSLNSINECHSIVAIFNCSDNEPTGNVPPEMQTPTKRHSKTVRFAAQHSPMHQSQMTSTPFGRPGILKKSTQLFAWYDDTLTAASPVPTWNPSDDAKPVKIVRKFDYDRMFIDQQTETEKIKQELIDLIYRNKYAYIQNPLTKRIGLRL